MCSIFGGRDSILPAKGTTVMTTQFNKTIDVAITTSNNKRPNEWTPPCYK